jgi:hypothetical protein
MTEFYPCKQNFLFMRLSTFLDFVGIALLVAAVVLLSLYSAELENVVKGVSYCVILGIGGVLLAVVLIKMIQHAVPQYFDKKGNLRHAATVGYLICLVSVFMFSLAYVDKSFARKATYEKKVRVIKKMKNYKYKTLYLKLYMGDREERFNPDQQVWDAVEEGDSLVLVIGKGAFGYDHALEFIPIKN